MRISKLIGLFAILGWTPLLWGLYPLPPEAAANFLASTNAGPNSELEAEFWFQWTKSIFLFLAGLTAGFLAYRDVRIWKASVLLTSSIVAVPGLYHIGRNIWTVGGLTEWWSTWVNVMDRLFDKGEFWSTAPTLAWFFVWPIFHLGLVLTMLVLLVGSQGERPLTTS